MDLAGMTGEVDAVDDPPAAEVLDEGARFQHRGHALIVSTSR
jgi:hypothetical protein